ncbi:MAG: phage tail tape measure protein, partial [Planctomycetaceae bacterium]
MATAGGIRAGRAFVELFADDSKLVRGLDAAKKRLQAFGASVRAIGMKMVAAGALVAGPLSLAVKAASDMEETMNKFNVVFGDNAAAMKEWGDEFAGQIGRSKKQIAGFLAGTQDLLVPIGFDAASAAEMSKQLAGLAVDLASFNNMADADVLRDLHAALTGSGEVMKKYGVIVSETAVKQELLNQGMDAKNATEQQKVLARMAIILRGTTAAQGDAVRSAGSFANQMKALRAKVDDAAVEIGSALLPVVTPLVTKIAEGVKVVGDWIKQNSGLVAGIAKIAAVIAAAGLAFIVIGTAISGFGATLGAVAAVITGVGTAIG